MSLKLNQSALISRSDRFGPAHHVQLTENAAHVRFDRRFTDEQICAYFFITSAASEELKDIDFTVGQRLTAHARRQFGTERRRYARFAGMYFTNRIQQIFQRRVL